MLQERAQARQRTAAAAGPIEQPPRDAGAAAAPSTGPDSVAGPAGGEVVAAAAVAAAQIAAGIEAASHSHSPRDALLLELLAWFKHEFFAWVDTVRCGECNGKTEVMRNCGGSVCNSKGRW